MRILKTLSAACFVLAASASAFAAAPEQKDVKLGIGGVAQLTYVTATLAERLGYFKEQGLNVELMDFAGGGKAMQALVGGSVDLSAGAYDGILRMQQKNQDIVGVIEFTRYYGASFGIRTDKADAVKSIADIKGMTIGVTSPGSGTQMMVWLMMAKAGLNKEDVSFVGVGAGPSAIAAVQNGEVDGICNLDPVMTTLEAKNLVKIVADARTTEGNTEIFGGPIPANAVMTKRDFINKNPNTVQAMVTALYKAEQWMVAATPEQIMAVVPESYYAADKEMYAAALEKLHNAYSRTGLITEEGHRRSLDFISHFETGFTEAEIPLSRAFDERFVRQAADQHAAVQ